MQRSNCEMIETSHWGEIVDNADRHTDIVTKDLKNGKNKQNLSSFETPALYQPSSNKQKKESSKRYTQWFKAPVDSKGQSYLLQSIELLHYKRRMRYMLSAAHSHQNEIQKGNIPETQALPTAPSAPKRFCSNEGRLIFQEKPSFLGVEYSAIIKKKGSEYKHFMLPMELDALSVRQLLLKSVAAVCAHSGFENANETALNTLTDITTEYFMKMCTRLKSYLERRPTGENNIDAFIQVFRQNCSEDLLSLRNYWVQRIKNVALKLEKEDRQLLEEYNALKESTSQIIVKEEKG